MHLFRRAVSYSLFTHLPRLFPFHCPFSTVPCYLMLPVHLCIARHHTGPIASMFWLDDALCSDVKLDGSVVVVLVISCT